MDELNASPVMQVATAHHGQPWNCTVYFVFYGGCFYWLSFPERRHSKELSLNPKAAVAIVVQSSQPVAGVQAEGDVEIIEDITEARAVLALYVEKYNQGSQFITHLEAGTNKHSLYRFTPTHVMVFNERDTDVQSAPSPREVVIK